MSDIAEIIEAKAEAFDALREIFFPDGSTLKLLKPSEAEREFDEITELQKAWFLDYSEFRQAFKLEIAIDDDTFTAEINGATHARVNDDIYIISNKDTIPPQGLEPWWKLFCERDFRAGQFKSLY